jgi:hypothetical protein
MKSVFASVNGTSEIGSMSQGVRTGRSRLRSVSSLPPQRIAGLNDDGSLAVHEVQRRAMTRKKLTQFAYM